MAGGGVVRTHRTAAEAGGPDTRGKGGALLQGPQRAGFGDAFQGVIKPLPLCSPGSPKVGSPALGFSCFYFGVGEGQKSELWLLDGFLNDPLGGTHSTAKFH